MLLAELKRMFPAAMASEDTSTVLCQDVIHRQWQFTRILQKTHADYSLACADIKSIFGRLTYESAFMCCRADDSLLMVFVYHAG
jgi:hypothetical protein